MRPILAPSERTADRVTDPKPLHDLDVDVVRMSCERFEIVTIRREHGCAGLGERDDERVDG